VPEWLTIQEAADYLKVNVSSIYRWCDEGRLPFYELESGGGRRFKAEDLDAMLRPQVGRAIVTVQALRREQEERLLDALQKGQPAREWRLQGHGPLTVVSDRPPLMARGDSPLRPRESNEARIRSWVMDAATAAGVEFVADEVSVSIVPVSR